MQAGFIFRTLIRVRRLERRAYMGLEAGWAYFGDVLEALRPARFAVIGVVMVSLVLGISDQARDALIAVGEDGMLGGRAIKLLVSTAAFALLVWVWARLGSRLRFNAVRGSGQVRPLVDLRRRFPSRPHIRRPLHYAKRRVRVIMAIRVQAPRVLAVLTFVAVAAALLVAADRAGTAFAETAATMRWLALAWMPAVAAFVLYALLRRRAWSAWLARRLAAGGAVSRRLANVFRTAAPTAAADVARRGNLSRPVWLLLAALSVVLLGIAVIAAAAPVAVGDRLGSIVVFFLIAGGLVSLGSLLGLFARRTGIPVMTGIVVLLVVLSALPSNHIVRVFPPTMEANMAIAGRPAADAVVERWMQDVAHCDVAPTAGAGPVPLIVVATAGGGSRAAYWTMTVLGSLRDRFPTVGDHILAVSGVSGGSLGAAVYAALESAARSGAFDGPFAPTGQRILAHDFLAPTLAAQFTRDLASHVLRFFVFDRAAVLEGSWEAAWRNVRGHDDNRMAGPFLDLWLGDGLRPWPALFLNGTVVETGDRIVASNLDVVASGVRALDALSLLGRDMPVSTAVNTSARFPYVGPAARYGVPGDAPYLSDLGLRTAGHRSSDRLPAVRRIESVRVVDGGYFDNFGATTALEVLRRIRAATDTCGQRRILPIVIEITSNPASEVPMEPVTALGGFLPQARAIPGTALATRNAHGIIALDELRRYTLDEAGGEYIRMRICPAEVGDTAEAPTRPPLGWVLSRAAQHEIENDLAVAPPDSERGSCNSADLCRLLCVLEAAGLETAGSVSSATGPCPCRGDPQG